MAAADWDVVEQMLKLGFTEKPLGAQPHSPFRFTNRDGLRIDYWPTTGRWNVVGETDYRMGPGRMLNYAKAHTTREGKVETRNAPVLQTSDWIPEPTGPGNPPWRE